MGDNESKILPLLIGDINLQEEYSKIYVNCNPEENDSSTATSGRSQLEIKEGEILFPESAAGKIDKKTIRAKLDEEDYQLPDLR